MYPVAPVTTHRTRSIVVPARPGRSVGPPVRRRTPCGSRSTSVRRGALLKPRGTPGSDTRPGDPSACRGRMAVSAGSGPQVLSRAAVEGARCSTSFGRSAATADGPSGSVVGEVEVWVWRDDLGSGGALGAAGGWRLDGNNTWVWEEPSPLDRPGAGTGALRGYAGGAGALPSSTSDGPERRPERRTERPVGDRALATLGDDPTPIFHELSVDRSRNIPRPSWRERDRDAVHVPEPHPGSGALPIQDEEWASGHSTTDAVCATCRPCPRRRLPRPRRTRRTSCAVAPSAVAARWVTAATTRDARAGATPGAARRPGPGRHALRR